MTDMTGLEPWFEYLPIPQQDGHKQTYANKHKSIDVENGVGNLYYNPDVSKNAELVLILTSDQFMYWQIWYEQILYNGLKWFECPYIGYAGTVEKVPARIVPQSKIDATIYGATDIKLKLQLTIAPIEKIPKSILVYYPYFDGQENFYIEADRYHRIVNVDAPTALTIPEI